MKLIDKDTLVAEIEKWVNGWTERLNNTNPSNPSFFEGGIAVGKHILSFIDTLEVKEVNFEKDVRQIISLYYEGIKHYDDIIKEERKENGGSDLAIKILDGVVDARELGIQYVIDKLKAQKGK